MKVKLIIFLVLFIATNHLYAQLELDNGVYKISEFQPLYTLENDLKVLRTTKHKFEAKLRQENGKLYIEVMPKYNNSALMYEGEETNNASVNDEQLFFDLESIDKFSFASTRFSKSIITLPFKVRFSGAAMNDSLSNVEFGLNNVNFFLGMNSTSYTYENNKLNKKSVSFGGFVGPTAIKLNNNNSSLALEEDINRLGLNMGLGIMGEINRFNFGVGLGIEMIMNQKTYNWKWNKNIFLGFILGVSL